MPYRFLSRLIPILLMMTLGLSWLAPGQAYDEYDYDEEELANLPEIKLEKARDLEALGEQAGRQRLPILLMFASRSCEYCEIMEQNYLIPMLRSGDYEDKVIIRVVQVDDLRKLRDFDGGRITGRDLTDRYGAIVTPTLVFLNPQGKALVPPIIGIGTEGFFGGEIDEAIERALQRL